METPMEWMASDRDVVLNDRWEMTNSEQTGDLEYRCRIPEDTGDTLCLYMKTYLPEFELLLDDEPLYSFSDIYAMKGRSQHIVRIPQNAEGKQLVIRANVDSYASFMGQNHIGNTYLGAEHEVVLKLLWDNLYALIFAIFAFLLGTGTLIAACWLRKSLLKEMLHSLVSFGMFILTTGIWVLTDSELLLLVTDRTAAVALVSFVSFMIMPVPLLRFINYLLGKRRIFDILCGLFTIIAAAYLLNNLFQAVPGYLLLLPSHLCCICAIVLVLQNGWRSLKSGKSREIWWIMVGFGLLSICVFLALMLFYNDPISEYSNFKCVGIFLFILCLMRAMFIRLYKQMEENASAAAYRRLAYLDSMTGLQNRTAFIEEQQKDEPTAECTYILFDINNLKQINDQYGHQKGDSVIIAAARCIKDIFGKHGRCFRIGGDEFVVILQDWPKAKTETQLVRMRQRIRQENEKGAPPLDIAIGCAVRQQDETAEQLFHQADVNMYEEKQRMKRQKINLDESQGKDQRLPPETGDFEGL